MTDVQLRRATEGDQAAIKQMVTEANLDRTALHWSHFIVAEEGGEIIGIGQVRPYPKCRELGSLAVKKAYRARGVGGQLIRALLAEERGDVYLECLIHNEAYYAKFGFQRISAWSAPMPLKFKAGVGGMILRLFGYRLIAMKREAG